MPDRILSLRSKYCNDVNNPILLDIVPDKRSGPGNIGTNPTNNFLGTIDNNDLVFRTNNTEKARITSSGNTGIGTNAPNASALLDITSTNKGLLPPRLSAAQMNAIVSPANGLFIYNTTIDCYSYYKLN